MEELVDDQFLSTILIITIIIKMKSFIDEMTCGILVLYEVYHKSITHIKSTLQLYRTRHLVTH